MTQEAVLITGGTSGIGRATAELLYERVIRVMVTGSSNEFIAAARPTTGGDHRRPGRHGLAR